MCYIELTNEEIEEYEQLMKAEDQHRSRMANVVAEIRHITRRRKHGLRIQTEDDELVGDAPMVPELSPTLLEALDVVQRRGWTPPRGHSTRQSRTPGSADMQVAQLRRRINRSTR